VVVDDLSTSDIYKGTDALDVFVKAGVRAMQSTPLITRSGRFIGIFCTHYRSSRTFADRDFRLLDMLARQAADAIERHDIAEARRAMASQGSTLHEPSRSR
jgi:GAF domain-containing protein